uniref:Hva1_TUDOR domain-containing protein n=1 Tax=Haemonchus contortus TaxID=6289 RepID=A0A7I4Y1N6_HAECO
MDTDRWTDRYTRVDRDGQHTDGQAQTDTDRRGHGRTDSKGGGQARTKGIDADRRGQTHTMDVACKNTDDIHTDRQDNNLTIGRSSYEELPSHDPGPRSPLRI